MAKKKNPAPTGDRRRGGDDAALAGSASLIAQNAPEGPDFRQEAWRRWPEGRILFGSGPHAVVSTCCGPVISLHPDWGRAWRCHYDLNADECAPFKLCRGRSHHTIVDLRKPARRRKQ